MEMPYFDYRGRQNDIIILKLKEPLTFTSNVKPVCLPAETFTPTTLGSKKTKCYTSGWGIKWNSPYQKSFGHTHPEQTEC